MWYFFIIGHNCIKTNNRLYSMFLFWEIYFFLLLLLLLAWTGKQMQYYSPPKVSLEAFFYQKDSSKLSSFCKGAARLMFCIHLCRNHLLWAFAAGILHEKLNLGIFLQEYVRSSLVRMSQNLNRNRVLPRVCNVWFKEYLF